MIKYVRLDTFVADTIIVALAVFHEAHERPRATPRAKVPVFVKWVVHDASPFFRLSSLYTL